MPPAAPQVFISYSHKDEEWKDRLDTQLQVLGHQGILDTWNDRRIEFGSDWEPEIEAAMQRAKAAVLLISADSLTSKFILSKEVPVLLERREKEGVKILPVIVRPCPWQMVPWLAKLQCRPKDGHPLSGGTDHQIEADLDAIAREIGALLK